MVEYKIIEHIATLSENSKGNSKQLNIVQWNNNPAKFDIREWSENTEKPLKGITLTENEMDILVGAMNNRNNLT